MDTGWNGTPRDVHHIIPEDDDMNRVCAAGDCECSLDGCHHDGRRKPAQARFCSSTCASRTKKSNYRKRKRRGLFAARHPEAGELLESTDSRSLAEIYDRARRPDHWAEIEAGPVDDELLEHSDYHDVTVYEDDQGDEANIYGDDNTPGRYDPDSAWRQQQEMQDAVEGIRAEYDVLLAPHRDALKRNPGVKPIAMSRLEQARDAEIREVTRSYQKSEAMQWAAREAPQRAVQAAERRASQAALNAFGRDLPGGSRRYQAPLWTGRPTEEIAVWR